MPDGQSGSWVVCGSRDWPTEGMWLVTAKIIELIPRDSLIITGGARGVDEHAHDVAANLGHPTKVMRANWNQHGKRAGYLRNVAMLDERPEAVLAFCNQASRGTMHTIREALKREIPLYWVKDEDLGRPELSASKALADEFDLDHLEGQ